MKYIAILGRQAEISLAELTSLFDGVRQLGPEIASFESAVEPNIANLGGSLKIARELLEPPIDFLLNLPAGKITLGVSDYSPDATRNKTASEALKLKKILARQGRSVRVLMPQTSAISTATAHHNQLAEKSNHIELIKFAKTWWLLTGVQNITAYAHRDQARPARDAKVGMLPPKLAQILINLCGRLPRRARILDPFCGTGVLLQEALLMGYDVYGTDLAARMIDYSRRNLEWLKTNTSAAGDIALAPGDATIYTWLPPLDAVACECYLGRPMSQPPTEIKLKSEKQACGPIILGFLNNLLAQIDSGTPVVLAIPAWLRPDGTYSRLEIIDEIEKMGYNVIKYKFAESGLLYRRERQVVAREIIVLRKK